MATWRFVAVASLWARLLVGQQAGVSDIKFVDHVPTGFWWRDATTDVKLDFLRAFQAGLSVSGLARFDIPVTDLASRLDKFYLVEANTPLTVAKAFMEVTKPSPNPSAAMSLPPPSDITQPPVTVPPLGAPQAKTSPDVYRVGGGVTAPALLYKVEPDYSEEARWALTHMLKMDPRYAPHYADALKLIKADTSSESALKSVYRESIGEIEVDLMAYIRRNPLPTMLVPVNVSETSGAMSAPVELKPSEVKHLLGQLPRAKWHKSIEVHQTSERPSVVAGH